MSCFTLKPDYRGRALQIQIKRGTETITYERTQRRALELFDSPGSEYGALFSSSRDFAKIFKGARLLDLGCGNGGLVSDLRRLGLEARGIDLHFDSHALPNKHLIEADAFRTGLADESENLITSSYSVFHYEPLGRLRELLEECLRILRPGGRMLLSPIHEGARLQHLRALCARRGLGFWQAPENKAIQILKIAIGNQPSLP